MTKPERNWLLRFTTLAGGGLLVVTFILAGVWFSDLVPYLAGKIVNTALILLVPWFLIAVAWMIIVTEGRNVKYDRPSWIVRSHQRREDYR